MRWGAPRWRVSRKRPPQPTPPQSDRATSGTSGEWLTIKARYKQPEGESSHLITRTIQGGGRVRHLPLASAVAEFGLLLRSGTGNTERWDALAARVRRFPALASQSVEFASFVELVEIAKGLNRRY